MNYNIRAEFKDGSKKDFVVIASGIGGARLFAEDKLADLFHGDRKPVEWRGLVAFVDCKPVEERIQQGINWRLTDVLQLRSIKESLRPSRQAVAVG